ncbi:MAG: maleylpyruvate isomerase N-terminal domain-containing protein, partial [Rubricoccaceae bacterium]|nr:maleylpyruvate isomerase N-terminal domain-containing protein [Rubricoccaceae bacterium]
MTSDYQCIQNALDIPNLGHDEAGTLATVEAIRLLALTESLTDDDWRQPTDCTEWTVREIVAHLAGGVASQASWAEFKRQNVSNPYMKEAALNIDGVNRL